MAGPANEFVIATASLQRVIPTATIQHIGEIAADHQLGRIIGCQHTLAKLDRAPEGAIGKLHTVDAFHARLGCDVEIPDADAVRCIARQLQQKVVSFAEQQNAGGQDSIAELDEIKIGRVARCRLIDLVGTEADFEAICIAALATGKIVGATTTDENIVSAVPIEMVVARAAMKDVIAVASLERIFAIIPPEDVIASISDQPIIAAAAMYHIVTFSALKLLIGCRRQHRPFVHLARRHHHTISEPELLNRIVSTAQEAPYFQLIPQGIHHQTSVPEREREDG